ncbi:hypothetical protein, partial [Hydrogenivirga sp. 128-5-R1-1]|uniref:beta strand repeat-containing protein n=1 Tax=Hydrogenivirga sp. 128-5-R1-1 TaxID=392423 RepID=UPI00015F1F74
TATKAQAVTINLGKAINETGTFNLSNAAQVTLNVDTALNSSNTETTKFQGVLNAPKATDISIDAKGIVKLTAGSSLAKAQNITLKAENKTSSIDLATNAIDLSAAAVVNISGNGSVSLSKVGTNGTTPVDYNVDLTATGLNGGLNISAIASKQNVSIDVSGVKGVIGGTTSPNITGANVTVKANGLIGNISLGTVDSQAAGVGTADLNFAGDLGTVTVGNVGGTSSFDTININASEVGNTISIGTLTADNAVTVNANGALNNVTIGAISQGGTAVGKQGVNSVTIDLSGTLGTNTIGTIKAISSLTYKAGLNATNGAAGINISVDNDGTHNFTADLTGGDGNDKLTFTLLNDKSDVITLKGNLGGGTDSITVDAATNVTTATNNVTIDLTNLSNYDSSTLKGSAGNDTIKLGNDVDTFIFNANNANGNDTINDFQIQDKLDMNTNLLTGITVLDANAGGGDSWDGFSSNPAAATDISSKAVIIYSSAITSGSQLVTALNAGGSFANLDLASTAGAGNDAAVVFVADSAAATSAEIYYVAESSTTAGDAGSATLIGTINLASGATIDDLVSTNIA